MMTHSSAAAATVLSCIQPTGAIHLGNYFGAIQNWVRLQSLHSCVYGIVDLHAMTVPYEPAGLQQNTRNMFLDLLACGIDPEKSVLFVQSQVPEHAELAWVLGCLSSYGELTRQTQFKDKSEKAEEGGDGFVPLGLFTYPVLQAADILAYRAKYVPVGQDQKQHLELTRNVAERFNSRFGEYFPVPEPLFTEIPKLASPADPAKKMSKSLGDKHCIYVFEEEASLRKKVKTHVTDSGDTPEGEISAGIQNLFNLMKACGQHAAVEGFARDYSEKALRYGDLKNAVADALLAHLAPIRARRGELAHTDVDALIRTHSAKARDLAADTMREVKKLVGLGY